MKSWMQVGDGWRVVALALMASGCAGQSVPEPSAPQAAPSAEPAPAAHVAPAESAAAAEPEPAVPDPAAAEGDAPVAEPVAQKPKDPNAQREVKYVVTPEGLKVDVAGVRFLVSAAAKQIAQGWGAKISVKAEALDGKEHVLMSPKNGPIAFAAAVFKKGSTEAERIPDAREGEGELRISASPVSFARDFPNKGGRVLAIGETLDMEVALWGLGTSADDRRPVKQFVHVKMKVEKGKPKAIVEPPASAAK
jgi:hypothetical protein